MLNSQPQIKNQAPLDFNKNKPRYKTYDSNPINDLKENYLKELSNQFYTPMNTQTPVEVTIDNQPYDIDAFIDNLTKEINDSDMNPQLSELHSILFHMSARYKSQNIENWQQLPGITQLIKNKYPTPSKTIKYTFDTDIQNQAKDVIIAHQNNQPKDDVIKELNLGLIGTLLQSPANKNWQFILIDENTYNKFKESLNNKINSIQAPQDVIEQNKEIQSIQLDDTENLTTWLIGNTNDENTINRIILDTLYEFENTTPDIVYTLLNMNVIGSLKPFGFSFINIESLINSDQYSFKKELIELGKLTNRMIAFKVKKLKKIQSMQQYQNTQKSNKKQYKKKLDNDQAEKRTSATFSKTLPTTNKQINRLKKIVNKNISKDATDNTFKTRTRSFMRPNRRHPDDTNIPGTRIKTSYRPDVHIYLDTSGSITEAQYKASITMLIKIAKKLNTNLYFTSFSHKISQPVKLQTKYASVKQIYNQIKAIPKVSGGTEYENVWNMIDTLQKKKFNMLNFVLTDFEYNVRQSYTPQLRNASVKKTYYLPLASDQSDYYYCRQYAIELADELYDLGDKTIYKRMLL